LGKGTFVKLEVTSVESSSVLVI